VAEILAGQKTQDAASRGESSAVEAAAFDIQAAIDQLSTAELGYDAREALFKKAKTAGQLGELIERLKARSEANPAIAEPHLELGQAYLTLLEGMPPSEESGRIAMAADRSFDRALEADGEHWEARFLKGMSLSFWPPVFGKQKIAIEQFETLRQQQVKSAPEPHHVQTYVYLGNLYSQQGKTEEARKVWEEGLRRHPGNEELKSRLR
jgi:tetratricopeptide (TPR) repeat protein